MRRAVTRAATMLPAALGGVLSRPADDVVDVGPGETAKAVRGPGPRMTQI